MKKNRTAIISLLLLLGTMGLCWVLIRTQMPKIRSYALVKIEQLSREHLPVRILPESVQIRFFPLGVSVKNIEIAPKEEFKSTLESATLKYVHANISPWQLLRGKVRLNSLEIEGVQIHAKIQPESRKSLKKKSNAPLEGIFELLGKIPVNAIEVHDFAARLFFVESRMALEISNVELTAEKTRGNGLILDLESASAQMMNGEASQSASLKLDFESHIQASRTKLEIENLQIRRGDSVFQTTGNLTGDMESLLFKELNLDFKSDLNIESNRNWAVKHFKKELAAVPPMYGRVNVSGTIHQTGGHDPIVKFKSTVKSFKTGAMNWGDITADGQYAKIKNSQEIQIPLIDIEHPSGPLKVKNFHFTFAEEKHFTGELGAQNIQLHEALKAIGVGAIPVFMQIDAALPCEGQLSPDFKISCKGSVDGKNSLVKGALDTKGTIVALKAFSAAGDLTIDKDKVEYAVDLSMPDSKGKSRGSIDYENGFKIFYEADRLSFKDVTNLADLHFEGAGRVRGVTEGNSKAATINLEAELSNFWLEDFWLGNCKGNLGYKSGTLNFSNMQGYYAVSRYNGDVKLDLSKKEISLTARSPFFDVRDLLKVFSHRVTLPFPVTGTGQAQIKASGPLAINKMTYDLKTSVFKGSVAGENFDQAFFDVKSNSGEVNAERVLIQRGNSTITLTGRGHSDGTIETVLQGRGFKLEDSALVSASGLALSGLVDFDMDMAGPVLSPNTDMRGRLLKTSIGDQPMPDSSFRLQFGLKAIEGSGSFLGDVLKTKFTIPLDRSSPFSLQLTTNEWNFAPVFAAYAGPNSRKDYEGRLTTNVDLSSQSGGFWNSTGLIQIDKFSLSRGQLALKSTEPALLKMKNGQMHVEHFQLSGSDTSFFKITESAKPVSKIDLQLSGKLDLTLLGILTPFLEDLRGIGTLSVNMRAGPEMSELLGSAYIEKGYVKFFDFPHPLEDIRIDLLFNQKKILFNSVKAEIGGGRISANGGMEIKGPKNYPIHVAGQFDKVTLNVPEKVRTSGSGSISFTGARFPFVLKADYDVKDGLWTKEFGGDSSSQGGIRRDQFLPELLLQERFVPVVLDLGINFSKGIVMKNELVDGKVTGAISVKGSPSKPSILGTVSMEKDTKISVKDTPFEVTTANILLEDPNDINPKLYIAARSRVQEFDISLLIQGNASKPDFTFTSVPPLANKDIISLLALGTADSSRTGPALQSGSPSQQQNGPSASVGALKNNPLSKEIKEKTGFDFQFSPGFDEQQAVQKIIIKRQFTNKLGVSASQALGNHRATDAEARYQLNDKVSGVLSWQNRDDLNSLDKSTAEKEQNQFGLDLEYKFEFK